MEGKTGNSWAEHSRTCVATSNSSDIGLQKKELPTTLSSQGEDEEGTNRSSELGQAFTRERKQARHG